MVNKLQSKFSFKRKEITNLKTYPITTDLKVALTKYTHLREYLKKIRHITGLPTWMPNLYPELKKEIENPNILYPVGDPVFVHIYKNVDGTIYYQVIEPQLTSEEQKLLQKIQDKIIRTAVHLKNVSDENSTEIFFKLYDKFVSIGKFNLFDLLKGKILLKDREQYERIKYYLIKERLGHGKLEPLLRDPYIEDIHILGKGPVWIFHKIWESMKTSISFDDEVELDRYIKRLSELLERPISEVKPIVDGILQDGSRVNFIYGKDISLKGSSFTIRKFSKKPISVTQLIAWNTFSAEEMAYIWLIIEAGMNIFVCGETASGKTTTLNAISTFIRPDWKVYSVEDTPELNIPHPIWQRLITREYSQKGKVEMYDLLKSALRSRPNYIIVGEIRGKEGYVAFQAMQTGHPVMSTFHAGDIKMLIQRLTGNPINVPISFLDNLNVVIFQTSIEINKNLERRAKNIIEIERYISELDKIAYRTIFYWDPKKDKHRFRGYYNSYILEYKVAPLLGIKNRKKIYEILEERKRILENMVENKIFDFYEVWKIIKKYYEEGPSSLLF